MKSSSILTILGFLILAVAGCETNTSINDSCGDGFLDPGEECDGLGDLTCASLGYYDQTGRPECTGECTLDATGCGPRCGDRTIDAAQGEVCDTDQFSGQTCESLGYHGGILACLADCTDYDLSACESAGECGDGIIQGNWGETCDGTELDGESCESLGYHGGTLACLADCTGYNLAACESAGECGDELVQSENGEVCDGANLDGQTCVSQGFYGGTLFCNGDCLGFSTDVCATVGRCGDGVIQGTYSEDCDGADLADETCQTRGWFAGSLICSGGCLFDETVCRDIRLISTGGYHSCAVLTDESMWCWGRGSGGQLGQGSNTSSLAPVRVIDFLTAGTTIASISVGSFHTCARRSDNTLWCWGAAGAGQLGNSSTTNANTPQQVTITDAIALGTGGNFTCAVKSNGSVWCWGDNNSGQLGNNTTTNANAPVQVQGLTSGYLTVSGGEYHTCAVKSDGTARCWGRGNSGQLGNGGTANSLIPVTVTNLSNAVSITAGMYHTCAVKFDGSAYCWGANGDGQLGDTTQNTRTTPQLVSSMGSGVTLVTTKNNTSCAVKTNGSAWCWGYNTGGQLGIGTTTSSLFPVQVSGMDSGVASIVAGFHQICALMTSGFGFCWGMNGDGQLGDGSMAMSTLPRPVNPPTL